MKIFLILYNRTKGQLVRIKEFNTSERTQAENESLAIELELNRQGKGLNHEVVILEAKSKDALRITHRRYFESINQIVESIKRHLESIRYAKQVIR